VVSALESERQKSGEAPKAGVARRHEFKAAGHFNRHGSCVKEKRRTTMKRQAYTLIALMVLVGSMAVAAQAQTSGRSELRANIPFAFQVGNQTLAAGEYTVRQINPSSDRAMLLLRSKDGRSSAMIQMNDVQGKAGDSARLVFHRYGNQFYFAEAWTSADSTGLQAAPSRAERAAREIAGMKSTSETVALKLR
jgi:hypothetical protein